MRERDQVLLVEGDPAMSDVPFESTLINRRLDRTPVPAQATILCLDDDPTVLALCKAAARADRHISEQ